MYDPGNSREWKEAIRWQVRSAGAQILEGPLVLSMKFYLSRPKSLPKKVVDHVKRPDLDNLCKAVLDALNGLCFKDDSQIVAMRLSKTYGPPGVEIEIEGGESGKDTRIET
jgi:Holliday junction resolvase RusA-like endonuclease